jgi:hypothetical protein
VQQEDLLRAQAEALEPPAEPAEGVAVEPAAEQGVEVGGAEVE